MSFRHLSDNTKRKYVFKDTLCKSQRHSVCDPEWHNVIFTHDKMTCTYTIINKLNNTNTILSSGAHETRITNINMILIKLPYK